MKFVCWFVMMFAPWLGCHAWMDQAVGREFAGFRKQGISKDSLEKTWKICKKDSRFKRYKIVRGRVYGPEDRMTNLLKVLVQRYPMADVDFIYYQQDFISDKFFNKNEITVPILASAKHKQSQQVVLFVDWYYDVLGTQESGWNGLSAAIDEHQNQWPWGCKIEKVFWRGGPTDSMYSTDPWFLFPRGKLILQSNEQPDLVDASFIIPNDGDPVLVGANRTSPFVRPVDQMQYKYQLDVDGITCTWPSLQWKLLSGCLVMKQNSGDIMWYHAGLEPWVHYVPVANDLSDLQDAIRWAKAHDREAQQIAEAGRAFAKQFLMPDQILLYCFKILSHYAALQKFQPTLD